MIKLQNITKSFPTGSTALDDVTFTVDKGEFVFLVGPSGSGKTTLFRLITREMTPTSGSIHIGQWDIVNLPKKHIPHLRKSIGVIFQDLKLLRDRTIFENILLPLEVAHANEETSKQRIEEILDQVGILEHKDKFPIQLSGGELQRAAIARALAFSPEIILADEPTGNLDTTTSWEIVKLLQDINKSGTTILMATHNTDIINSLMKRIIVLEKGKLVDDKKRVVPHAAKKED
ncbi:MAG TPA: cell division ATP-binding protein FtsE [Candidatus Saccharimonadales bacterium]|nr:cell division ATP-binding protein FtsE [Candidatus Saccharimonadales bacterium]